VLLPALLLPAPLVVTNLRVLRPVLTPLPAVPLAIPLLAKAALPRAVSAARILALALEPARL
jgi:hypothetical protein